MEKLYNASKGNLESGIKRSLEKNTVAQSLPDGSLDIRAMTQEELNMQQEHIMSAPMKDISEVTKGDITMPENDTRLDFTFKTDQGRHLVNLASGYSFIINSSFNSLFIA